MSQYRRRQSRRKSRQRQSRRKSRRRQSRRRMKGRGDRLDPTKLEKHTIDQHVRIAKILVDLSKKGETDTFDFMRRCYQWGLNHGILQGRYVNDLLKEHMYDRDIEALKLLHEKDYDGFLEMVKKSTKIFLKNTGIEMD